MAAQQDPQELERQFQRLQTLATTLRKDLTRFDLSNLRNDAALVGELLEKWEDGYEIVYSVRRDSDSLTGFKRNTSKIF